MKIGGANMNVIWSKYVQGIKSLYYSRKLRFDDIFSAQYKRFFHLDESNPLKILEIGCGRVGLDSADRRSRCIGKRSPPLVSQCPNYGDRPRYRVYQVCKRTRSG